MYTRSAAITSVELTPDPQLLGTVEPLAAALGVEDHRQVQAVSQRVVNHVCRRLGVRRVRVHVKGVCPSNRRGALHGL